MRYLKERFNMELLVIPLVVRVFSLIHMWQFSIRKLNSVFPVTLVSHAKVTLRAQKDAIAEQVRTSVLSWFPVMWLPAPVGAFGSIAPSEPLTAGSTQPTLSVPSLLFSIGRKSHRSGTSRNNVRWVKNDDMWVLLRDGVSYNVAIMYFPPSSFSQRTKGEYRIFKGSKIIGYSRTLAAAKRRAEKIKTPKQPFK